MILNYIYNICRFKIWRILLFIGIYMCLYKLSTIIYNSHFSVTQLVELHKCPACYGISACPNIHNVNLLWYNVDVVFSHLFGVKNVFFGTYNGSKVVLKKLAHSSELKTLDVVFCNKLQLDYPCFNISQKKLHRYAANFYDHIKKTITSNFSQDDLSRLRLCPIIQHLDELFYNVHLNNHNVDTTQYIINLWTLVLINPEPIVLQILPAENGWPVPKYFGACGRIVIEEYVGLPLIVYYNKPWIQRAKIVSSLLNAAHMFTFKNENFSFYLTDVSADNIAVDYKNVAKFIDLENIIIVDKNISPKDRPKGWYKLDENIMHFDCPDCFIFSPEDICNHHLSDHNYYAICQLLLGSINNNLFPGSFLHDIPINIKQQYSNMEFLLQQCAIPNSTEIATITNTRIASGQQLKTLLDEILSKHFQYEYNKIT